MFISYEDKKRIKQDLIYLNDIIVKLDYRLGLLEANAEKYGYRKLDGKPKRNVGRPRKQEVAK